MMIIPTHIQIETINGVCTSRCIMCPVFLSTRKPNVLAIEDLEIILGKFIPYRENIKYISLFGSGEPLLDKDIIKKIEMTKNAGFKGIGFPTNCTELDEQMSVSLIRAGLDTIICSIDGISKKTHESIRVGTNFEDIVYNVKRFIAIRNKLRDKDNIKTKVIIRLIYQNANKGEWPEFYNYWSSLLNKDIGDGVIKFNVINYKSVDDDKYYDIYDRPICGDIFERFIILSNGDVSFCCGDYNEFFDLGNVIHDDPIKIYNNEIYNYYRKLMYEGRILDLEHCKNCKLPLSRKPYIIKNVIEMVE